MPIQFVYGFLSGISITFLKYIYGPFTNFINFHHSIIEVFVSPVEDFSANFFPLYYHFLSPVIKKTGPIA